jgi:hypothetical protein
MKPMRRFRLSPAAIAVAVVVMATSAWAQAPAEVAKPALDPGAMAALQGMGTYLRTLKAFQVEVATTDEDVLDDGQKLQYDGVTTILAQMPDRVRAEVTNRRYQRLYLYDGKNFTLFAQRANFYATEPAPPTVGKLDDMLSEKYGFSVPLADLFRWGGPNWSTEGITAATDFGPDVVGGTTCAHYGFRQADIDWQIWIQRGDYPLPRKLVITTKTDEARPQHTAVYTWNLAPSFNDAAFTFDPPAGVGKVVLAESTPAAGAAK